MSEDWGPWIEHDGKGCPCRIGETVQIEGHTGAWGRIVVSTGVITSAGHSHRSWIRRHSKHGQQIIRYRIRKPRGLTILEGVLENLPEQVDA